MKILFCSRYTQNLLKKTPIYFNRFWWWPRGFCHPLRPLTVHYETYGIRITFQRLFRHCFTKSCLWWLFSIWQHCVWCNFNLQEISHCALNVLRDLKDVTRNLGVTEIFIERALISLLCWFLPVWIHSVFKIRHWNFLKSLDIKSGSFFMKYFSRKAFKIAFFMLLKTYSCRAAVVFVFLDWSLLT